MLNKIRLKYFIIKNILLFKWNNSVNFGSSLRIRGPFKFDIRNGASLQIGDNLSLTSSLMINPLGRNLKSMFQIDENAKIVIGDNVGMSCVSLWAKKNITIGNNVKLGAGVIIMDSDMHSLDHINRRNFITDEINAKSKEIIIGDDVFIGVSSIITKGIVIGDRSIVAAGSVVVKSIPKDEIWGGNPAKFLRKIN